MAKRPLSEQLEILAGVVKLIRDELPSDIDEAAQVAAYRLAMVQGGSADLQRRAEKGGAMSNTTLLLEALALTKDAYDRLERTSFNLSEAESAFRVSAARFLLASAHEQLEEMLFSKTGRESCEP